MGPLENLMNKVDGWCQPTNEAGESQSVWVRYGSTRAVSVLGCAPLEVAAVAENALYGVAQGLLLGPQFLVNTFSCISGAECCDFVTHGKGTVELVSDFLATVYKVIAYTVGTASTVILGFAAPAANLSLHSWAGIFENKRENAASALEAQRLQEQLEADAEKMQKEIIAQRLVAEAAAKAEQEKQEAAKLAEQVKKEEADQVELLAQKEAELAEQVKRAADLVEQEKQALEATKQTDAQPSVNTVQATAVAEAVAAIDEATVNNDIIEQPKQSKLRYLNPLNWNFSWLRRKPQAT